VRCELDSAISNYDPAARRRIPLSEQRESEAPPPLAGDGQDGQEGIAGIVKNYHRHLR
jgi:hypothetical protein